MHDFDLDLLRTFVHVVDCGGFTRAGERVHRTQSTISQQIKRLEDQVGRPLLLRQGRTVVLTEAGETLIGFARRMLALQNEAQALLVRREASEIIRLGIPEDFAGRHLPRVLAAYARAHPEVRLDVRCDLACNLLRDFEHGDLDVALVKGEAEQPGAIASWPEPMRWAASAHHPLPQAVAVPLALFHQGCIFRRLALEMLDRAGIAWRIAYSSPSLQGLQAAVASGMAISPLGTLAHTDGLRWLDDGALGLPPLPAIRFSLLSQPGASAARAQLTAGIAETVETAQRHLDAPLVAV
jgi:DNA-binding transcriptional LysR family regulator